jgi:hypothetical protein
VASDPQIRLALAQAADLARSIDQRAKLAKPITTTLASQRAIAASVAATLAGVDVANFIKGSIVVTPTPVDVAPTTPAGLAASTAAAPIITLSTPATNALGLDHYVLERAPHSGAFSVLAASIGGFPYTDSSASPNTAYDYRTRAYSTTQIASAYSNTATVTTPAGSTADVTAPTTPGSAPSLVSKTTDTIVLTLPPTTDPNPGGGQLVSGMADYLVKVGGVLRGSPVAHPSATLSAAAGSDLGSPPIAGSSSLSTGTYTLTGSGDWGGSSDQGRRHPFATLVGDFDVVVRFASLSSAETYARSMFRVVNGPAANAQYYGVGYFQTIGMDAEFRASAGGVGDYNGSHFAHSAPYYARLTRVGSLFSSYLSASNGAWGTAVHSLDMPTMPASLTLEGVVTGSQVATGTATFDNLTLTVPSTVQFTDTFSSSSSPTARLYTYAGRDAAGNVSTYSSSLSVTPTATGSTIKWHPGHYASSLVFTNLGNKNSAGANARPIKNAEIDIVRAGPAACLGWEGYYFWRAIENVKDAYDFGETGCGLDADYVRCTGYTSGSRGSAIYNAGGLSPRRFAIFIQHTDYFDPNPANRCVPDYILNSATYGAVGPNGTGHGYWTVTGTYTGGGSAPALWRSSVMTRYAAMVAAIGNHVLPDGWTVNESPYVEWIKLMLETAALMPQGTSDPSFSYSGLTTQLHVLDVAAVAAFPNTNVASMASYLDDANELQNYVATFPATRIAMGGGPDVFGASSGQNVVAFGALVGYVFGQALYTGLRPPAGNPYAGNWPTGGTDYRGVIPYIGTIQNTEMIAAYGRYFSPPDLVTQVNSNLQATHVSWHIESGHGGTDATANWFGTAADYAHWNAATSGGVLATIVNSPITHTAYPSAYP